MATPYVGEIRMFGGNFAPAGWAACDGQALSIDQNDTLFNLIGTTYGGDGQTTFNLPDLQGRLPMHVGSGFQLAQTGGSEQVTLTAQQIPQHTHPMLGSEEAAVSRRPENNLLAQPTLFDAYVAPGGPVRTLNAQLLSSVGGNQPHDNMQPYLVIMFIISLYGVFPTQN